jgi:hypothetical protein
MGPCGCTASAFCGSLFDCWFLYQLFHVAFALRLLALTVKFISYYALRFTSFSWSISCYFTLNMTVIVESTRMFSCFVSFSWHYCTALSRPFTSLCLLNCVALSDTFVRYVMLLFCVWPRATEGDVWACRGERNRKTEQIAWWGVSWLACLTRYC